MAFVVSIIDLESRAGESQILLGASICANVWNLILTTTKLAISLSTFKPKTWSNLISDYPVKLYAVTLTAVTSEFSKVDSININRAGFWGSREIQNDFNFVCCNIKFNSVVSKLFAMFPNEFRCFQDKNDVSNLFIMFSN